MSVTDEILKFDKLIDINELHPENILFILVTNEVLKLDKLIDCNELHL